MFFLKSILKKGNTKNNEKEKCCTRLYRNRDKNIHVTSKRVGCGVPAMVEMLNNQLQDSMWLKSKLKVVFYVFVNVTYHK